LAIELDEWFNVISVMARRKGGGRDTEDLLPLIEGNASNGDDTLLLAVSPTSTDESMGCIAPSTRAKAQPMC
jgi:hypothetical protein